MGGGPGRVFFAQWIRSSTRCGRGAGPRAARAADFSVGREGLEPPTVGVGKGELRAGMRPFPTDQHPHAFRPARGVRSPSPAEQPVGSRCPTFGDDDCQVALSGECLQHAWARFRATLPATGHLLILVLRLRRRPPTRWPSPAARPARPCPPVVQQVRFEQQQARLRALSALTRSRSAASGWK